MMLETDADPLETDADGNCLLHALSLALAGFHDRERAALGAAPHDAGDERDVACLAQRGVNAAFACSGSTVRCTLSLPS